MSLKRSEPIAPHVAPASMEDAAWAAFAELAADMLVLLDGSGRIAWVNPSFVRISGWQPHEAIGKSLPELMGFAAETSAWADVASSLAAGTAVDGMELPWRHRVHGTQWGCLSTRALPSVAGAAARTAVSLQDLTEQHRLGELLETAQEFGRLGVWERKIPSGEGRWDRHVFRFFGMDATEGTPDYELAAKRIHPDDVVRVNYPASTLTPGKHEARYRVVLPNGGMQRLHSQWEVKTSPEGEPDRTVGIMVDDTETYELAQAFNDTSEQLRLAVDLGNIAIWRHDLRTNRFHYNYRAYQVLDITPRPEGLSLEEVRSLIHPDDMPRVIAAAHTALNSDRPVDMEARYRRSDGSWRYVLTRRVLRRDAAGEPLEFVGVALDVTEQVEKSRRANELAQRLEIATHSAGVGVFSRDPETEEGEWNTEMFRLNGRRPELGVPTRDEWVETIIHPDDRPMMRRVREALLESPRDKAEQQYRVVWPNGEVRWLVNRARRVLRNGRAMIFGVTLDVTDRVRTEDALRSANERVALTARSVGLGTWEWQPQTDKSTWDDQMYRLRGLEPAEVPPNAPQRREVVHPEDRDRVEALLGDAIRHKHPAAYEFRVVWPDGSVHWLASRSTPVAGTDGGRYIGVNWDITEAVNAESARREKFIAQRESEAKSQFLARMSHELRTPLNAVLGFAQLLQLDGAENLVEQRARIDHILAAGEHLLSLINDVLDLSSLESGQLKLDMQSVPASELVSEALPLVTPLADGFGVKILAGPIDGVAWGDRIRLRQVLINLLSNAIKYNRPEGTASVQARVKDGQVCISVSDTGRGLTPDQQSHLFEPFNRLGIETEGIEGTGIGLAIVKTLVTRMGGSIGVASEPGKGSTFEVRLQTADKRLLPESEDAAAHMPKTERVARAKLLYIEDNPINVMLMEELVASREGWSIVCETNGANGVARALETLPDIILVDMQLPDFDGFEVLRRLRAEPRTRDTPCIAVSANAMADDVARALAAGFAEYWTKPISFAAFLSSLEARLAAAASRSFT